MAMLTPAEKQSDKRQSGKKHDCTGPDSLIKRNRDAESSQNGNCSKRSIAGDERKCRRHCGKPIVSLVLSHVIPSFISNALLLPLRCLAPSQSLSCLL